MGVMKNIKNTIFISHYVQFRIKNRDFKTFYHQAGRRLPAHK